MKKTFCILEQGHTVNESLTLKKKEMFTTEFSDFYRLNWYQEDPNAFIVKKNITWSEGRSLLYERVPKKYDYYIFIDDDIQFDTDSKTKSVAEKIQLLLKKYNPVTGTFLNINQWYVNRSDIKLKRFLSKKCFPISGYDLEVQIFSQDFAGLMFPVIYHGSHKSMWYSQWLCFKLFPLKQICFTQIQVRNLRHNDKFVQKSLPQYTSRDKLMWLFNKDVRIKDVIYTHQDVLKNNMDIFDQKPDKKPKRIFFQDLNKIYDTNNFGYQHRKPLGKEVQTSDLRKTWDDLRFRVSMYKRLIQHKFRRLFSILRDIFLKKSS